MRQQEASVAANGASDSFMNLRSAERSPRQIIWRPDAGGLAKFENAVSVPGFRAKHEAAVKTDGVASVKAEADGHAEMKPEADGHAAVKAEADGHASSNGQPALVASLNAAPVTQMPAAVPVGNSVVAGLAFQEHAKAEQPAPADMLAPQ